MSKQSFKSQAKRKRELAKLDKRLAKDQKRALRKAEQHAADPALAVGTPAAVSPGARPSESPRKPQTLAEAALLWKSTRIVKPRSR
jgi:hypothetical protein